MILVGQEPICKSMHRRLIARCPCEHMEHQVDFGWFTSTGPDDYGELYITTSLANWTPWYKRIWYGLLYVLGRPRGYQGAYEQVSLPVEDVEQLIGLLQQCVKELRPHG